MFPSSLILVWLEGKLIHWMNVARILFLLFFICCCSILFIILLYLWCYAPWACISNGFAMILGPPNMGALYCLCVNEDKYAWEDAYVRCISRDMCTVHCAHHKYVQNSFGNCILADSIGTDLNQKHSINCSKFDAYVFRIIHDKGHKKTNFAFFSIIFTPIAIVIFQWDWRAKKSMCITVSIWWRCVNIATAVANGRLY